MPLIVKQAAHLLSAAKGWSVDVRHQNKPPRTRRRASLFVREKLGGAKAWLEELCAVSAEFSLVGDWDHPSSVKLIRADANPGMPVESNTILQPGATFPGTCLFWDRHRGWGKLVADGSSVKIFAHCRDIQVNSRIVRRCCTYDTGQDKEYSARRES